MLPLSSAFPWQVHIPVGSFDPIRQKVLTVTDGNQNYVQTGLDARDYFAAMAMNGDWSSQSLSEGSFTDEISDSNLETRAKVYYRMADAMLKARGQ